MSLGLRAAPMFPQQQSRFVLFGETLEDRCLLSVNSPLDVAIQSVALPNEQGYFSPMVEPSSNQSQQGVLVSDVLANGASSQLAGPFTMQPADASDTSDNDGLVPLIAVPPDDSIGPFVECPGLDEDFCLPREINYEFDIDLLNELLFG